MKASPSLLAYEKKTEIKIEDTGVQVEFRINMQLNINLSSINMVYNKSPIII
jgi:hypothetical protein